MIVDWFDDSRTDEELRWGPCDCHEDSYWDNAWERNFVAYETGYLEWCKSVITFEGVN